MLRHGLVYGSRDADTAWYGQLLNTLGQNHPRASDCAVSNYHFTQTNADSYFWPDLVFETCVRCGVVYLERECGDDSIRRASELGHQRIPA